MNSPATATTVGRLADKDERFAKFGTFVLSAALMLAIVTGTTFVDQLTTSRLLIVLVGQLLLHILICPRLLVNREVVIAFAFFGYLLLSSFWTPDPILGMNTLFPSIDFALIVLLSASLMAFHDPRVVLAGILAGFMTGAAIYTATFSFPFVYPQDFSYNAIASMYLFGAEAALFFGLLVSRYRLLALVLALVCLLHVGATTSIKTNLGVVIGAAAATLLYPRNTGRLLWRSLPQIVIAVGVTAYVILSNPNILERVTAGLDRIQIGLSVLQTREDVGGYSGFGEREQWMQAGLEGWKHNPLFGNGVEAFRSDNEGWTSHSTPVDLLYNTGLIGTTLFYGLFLSVGLRLFHPRCPSPAGVRALVMACLVAQVFMTLSGTLFYQTFVALLLGIASVVVRPVPARPS